MDLAKKTELRHILEGYFMPLANGSDEAVEEKREERIVLSNKTDADCFARVEGWGQVERDNQEMILDMLSLSCS